MKYTLEEIYLRVGREDKIAGITLRPGSASHEIYGDFLNAMFLYTQKEREEMDKLVQSENFSKSGFVKGKALVGELSRDLKDRLKEEGIHSDDIIEILYFRDSEKNTFHSKEKRSIHKITIPITTLPKGQDLNWMYGFRKKQLNDNIGLCPRERNFYLAGKYYYEPDKLTDDEFNEVFISETEMSEQIEFEYLGIKYMREEISEDEKKRLAELLGKKKRECYVILDNYLKQSGSSLNKLVTDNQEQAVDLLYKTIHFKERRLNVTGKKPIYIDLDSYLHIYMRHVEEMKVNSHFEHKDNFQWSEEDVYSVMEHVIKEFNDNIQNHFEENPNSRYSKYGSQSGYYQGDYYTFHIESSGRVSTFHKNKKEHEKKASR